MKRVISLLLIFIMVFTLASVSAADSFKKIPYSKVPTTGTPSKTEGYASFEFTIMTKDNGLITSGGGSIGEYSTRYLQMYASTLTGQICDEVQYKIYLQKWDGYNWVDQSPFYSDTDYNDDYVSGWHFKSVDVGYYRIKTIHHAEDGEETDTYDAYSDYIYVD